MKNVDRFPRARDNVSTPLPLSPSTVQNPEDIIPAVRLHLSCYRSKWILSLFFALINGFWAQPWTSFFLQMPPDAQPPESLLPRLITLPMFKQSERPNSLLSNHTSGGCWSGAECHAAFIFFLPRPLGPTLSALGPLFNLREVKSSLKGSNRAWIKLNSVSIHWSSHRLLPNLSQHDHPASLYGCHRTNGLMVGVPGSMWLRHLQEERRMKGKKRRVGDSNSARSALGMLWRE